MIDDEKKDVFIWPILCYLYITGGNIWMKFDLENKYTKKQAATDIECNRKIPEQHNYMQ